MNKLSKKNWYRDERDWWATFHHIMNKQWLLDSELNLYFRKPIDEEKINYLFLEGGYLLDVGCGSGHFSHSIHSLGMNVLGIDFSLDQIKKARVDYSPKSTRRIEFICKNFLEWDYLNYIEAFDSINIEAFLHHLPDDDVNSFFEIVGLVLKPGGKVFMYEPIYYEDKKLSYLKKSILRLYSISQSILINKIPKLFNLIDKELLIELSKGYKGISPHERALSVQTIRNMAKKNKLHITSLSPKRYKSIGYFLNIMTIIPGAYNNLLRLLCPVVIYIDKLLFRFFPNSNLGSDKDFLLYAIQIKKNPF
jgi:2-polyprenyl-3-methyl-5-hydroxy-6-metoxy-1,4-benzoquinol methylase